MFTRLFFTLVLLALVTSSFASSVTTDSVSVPIFLTSSAHVFPNRELIDSTIPSMDELVNALHKQSSSVYVNPDAEAVNRIVILAYDQLSMNDFSKYYTHFIYLLPALNAATTAMLYHDSPFINDISALSQSFASITEIDCINTVGQCEQSLHELELSTPLKIELVIVRVSTATPASSLKSILAISQSASTAMIITASTSRGETMNFHPTSVSATRLAATNTTRPTWNPNPNVNMNVTSYVVFVNGSYINGTSKFIWIGPQYITPNIFFGLMLGLFLIFMLYQALSCMTSIQRPVRLSATSLVISKEY